MSIHKNVRTVRKQQKITQEEMASRLEMSTSGYAKLERGQSQLIHDKLPKIAEILGVSLQELVSDEQGVLYVEENYANASYNNFGKMQTNQNEIDKLKLNLAHKDEIIHYKDTIIQQKDQLLAQKDKEILALNEVIDLLKKQLAK
ncbi:MAG: helix-turn-helix transcriptional regulator [Pasteurella sp.]|nr:helix-turn-helix transcriptional regulator [Pasteurella sp.]